MLPYRIILKIYVIIALGFALPAYAYDTGEITITGPKAPAQLSVEIAQTKEDRITGLMNRTTLDPYDGMLFDFKLEQPIAMWMKNTLIPLDMVFFNRQQEVVFIRPNAKPNSLEAIASPVPVRYVLELPGGHAAKYGLKKGHRFEWVTMKDE